MKSKLRSLVGVSATITLCAVTLAAPRASAIPDPKGTPVNKAVPVKTSANDVVRATEKFGFQLYNKLSVIKPTENCFISPVSVAIALNLAMAGSDGATRAAMAKGLGFANERAESSEAFQELLKSLVSDDAQVEMNIANAIFINDKFKLNASYEQNAKSRFQSEVRNENFADVHAVDKINSWVSDKTKKHIPALMTKLSPDAVAVLLNAVYFKGAWQTPFALKSTAPGDFHYANGQTKKVAFMNRTDDFDYFEEKDFQALKLPYGGRRFQALVFLPKPAVKLSEFQKRFNSDTWRKYMSRFESYSDSHVSLPRFKLDYRSSLNESLKSLGFEEMYSTRADFSLMHTPPPPLHVSDVVHQATLDVDEKGTVATAATSVTMMPTMAAVGTPRKFTMVVNRPFIFAVRDTKTEMLLFFGAVNNPQKKD